jgi:pimeloyl-ACP methyl ester carboxylesterase
LNADYTVIALDLRGHGQSDAPIRPEAYTTAKMGEDILAVADACGVARFALWAMSYGGKVSRYLAARSDRVSCFVMMGTPLGAGVSGERRRQAVDFVSHWSARIADHPQVRLDPDSLSADDRDFAQRFDVPVMLAWVQAMLQWPSMEPADFLCPTLWLVGTKDRHALVTHAQFRAALQGSQVTTRILEGLDHDQVFDDIDRVLPIMLAFMGA